MADIYAIDGSITVESGLIHIPRSRRVELMVANAYAEAKHKGRKVHVEFKEGDSDFFILKHIYQQCMVILEASSKQIRKRFGL